MNYWGLLAWTMALGSIAACNYSEGDCYPRGQGDGNPSAGGGNIIPGGVGGFGDSPPKQPQNATDPKIECNISDEDNGGSGSSSGGASELGTYVRCLGLDPTACAIKCNAIGAYCVELASHPKKSDGGIGTLKQCMNNTSMSTCTYCYSNKDVCSFIYVLGRPVWSLCNYTGGKGCE
jgi:hypothetical protein